MWAWMNEFIPGSGCGLWLVVNLSFGLGLSLDGGWLCWWVAVWV